jgi:hypothetical protein
MSARPILTRLTWAAPAILFVACSATLPLLDENDAGSRDASGPDVVSPPPDADGPIPADGGTDGEPRDAAPDVSLACAPGPLMQDGSVVFGCVPTSVSFSTTLAEPREGGACAPGTTPFQENGVDCCITGADASVADVPVPVTFDVDSGVLVWNGRVFAAMPGPEYKVFPPTNTEETYDAAASVLARGGASLAAYERFFRVYRAADVPGGDFDMSTYTRVTLDLDAGTFALRSERRPNAIYTMTCSSRARVRMTTPEVPLGARDAARD